MLRFVQAYTRSTVQLSMRKLSLRERLDLEIVLGAIFAERTRRRPGEL